MSLFTSNFEDRLLLSTTFLTAAIILITYHCLVIANIVKPGVGESPRKDNVICLENYMNTTTSCQVLLAGSSLLAKVSEAGLPSGWESLSFKGATAITGLQILNSSHRKPQVVIVEISSTLTRPSQDHPLLLASKQPNPLVKLSPIF